MSVNIRSYNSIAGYSPDFHKVCDFLIRINQERVITPSYLWGRWVWQFGPYMSMENLSHIGVAEDNGIVVGLATYESDLGEALFCMDDKYSHLKPQMIDYALQNLSKNGELKINLSDVDGEFQHAAIRKGFIATTQKDSVAKIDIDLPTYTLPDGYRIISFDDTNFDVERYYNAIWRGFNNQRQRNEKEMQSMMRREGFDAPHLDLSLRLLVVAPNGDYASHCGMWHLPGSDYAYVEPVFTLPEYRRMGLGKAAVLEGAKRCGARSAKCAYVLSSQQFYYSIGFYPVHSETVWVHTG